MNRLVGDKFVLGSQEYEVICRKENLNFDEYLFNNVDQLESLKKFYNNSNQVLSAPVLSLREKEDFYCVLQISEPCVSSTAAANGQGSPTVGRAKRRRLFNIKDELLLQLVAKVVALCIDSEYYRLKIMSLRNYHKEFAKTSELTYLKDCL